MRFSADIFKLKQENVGFASMPLLDLLHSTDIVQNCKHKHTKPVQCKKTTRGIDLTQRVFTRLLMTFYENPR